MPLGAAAALSTLLLSATGAGAQSTAPACDAPAAAVKGATPVRVPIDVSNNHVLVRVCVGNRSLTFLLDTGAGLDVLDISIARELGLSLGAPMNVGGAGAGSLQGFQLKKSTVRVAGVAADFPLNATWEMRRLRASKGRPIDGILGQPFIAKYVLAIDYQNSELRLHDRGPFKYAGTGATVPLTLENGQPQTRFTMTLAGGERVEAKTTIDVGSSGALILTKPLVEKHQLRGKVGPLMPWGGGGGIGGPVTSDIGRVPRIDIGAASLSNVTASLFGDNAGVFSGNPTWDANVGGDILRRFVVYFDYGAKRMILEPNSATNEPFEVDMSGLRVAPDTSLATLRVNSVTPNSPAAEAGVQAGDVILQVDGRDVVGSDADPLRARLRRAGETLELTLRRGESVVRVRLVTRRLV